MQKKKERERKKVDLYRIAQDLKNSVNILLTWFANHKMFSLFLPLVLNNRINTSLMPTLLLGKSSEVNFGFWQMIKIASWIKMNGQLFHFYYLLTKTIKPLKEGSMYKKA